MPEEARRTLVELKLAVDKENDEQDREMRRKINDSEE